MGYGSVYIEGYIFNTLRIQNTEMIAVDDRVLRGIVVLNARLYIDVGNSRGTLPVDGRLG